MYSTLEMEFVYIKIDNIKYCGKSVYYQRPIETRLHKAVVFGEHYDYFYDYEPHSCEESKDPEQPVSESYMKPLGSFRGIGTQSSGYPFYTVDHDVYIFDEDSIHEYNRDRLYCRGIPESPVNLDYVVELTYLDYSVFVSKR